MLSSRCKANCVVVCSRHYTLMNAAANVSYRVRKCCKTCMHDAACQPAAPARDTLAGAAGWWGNDHGHLPQVRRNHHRRGGFPRDVSEVPCVSAQLSEL